MAAIGSPMEWLAAVAASLTLFYRSPTIDHDTGGRIVACLLALCDRIVLHGNAIYFLDIYGKWHWIGVRRT